MRYIDSRRSRWGIEPICGALQVAPATYYAARRRPLCARRRRDEVLKVEIDRVHAENRRVYGAERVRRELKREGTGVARCTVDRLMGDLGLVGVRRGRAWKRTTTSDETHSSPADLVERRSVADRPNRLWVADLTYMKTHVGFAYVAFVIDVFSRFVVSWQASTLLRSALALDALEMASTRADPMASLVSFTIPIAASIPVHSLHRAPRRGRRGQLGRQSR